MTDQPMPDAQHFGWPTKLRGPALAVSLILAAYYFAKLRADLGSLDGLVDDAGRIIGGDFINLWAAAKLCLQGKILTLFDLQAYHAVQETLIGQPFVFHNWSYPPHIIPWLAGFGLLPYLFSLTLWIILTFAFFAVAVAFRRPQPWLLSALLLLAPSSFQNILAGQYGFVIAACLVGGLRLLPTRPVWAGILFGIATVKPQLVILSLAALLITRKWRALAAAMLTVAAMAGLSIMLFGLEPWQKYVAVILPFQTDIMNVDPKYEYSLMIPTPFMAARILGASTVEAQAIALPFMLAGLAVTAYAFYRPAAPDRRAGILLTATFIIMPYVLCYDMTALTAGLVSFIATQNNRTLTPSAIALIIAVWLLPILVFWLNLAHLPLSPLILSAFLIWQTVQLRNLRKAEALLPTANA